MTDTPGPRVSVTFLRESVREYCRTTARSCPTTRWTQRLQGNCSQLSHTVASCSSIGRGLNTGPSRVDAKI